MLAVNGQKHDDPRTIPSSVVIPHFNIFGINSLANRTCGCQQTICAREKRFKEGCCFCCPSDSPRGCGYNPDWSFYWPGVAPEDANPEYPRVFQECRNWLEEWDFRFHEEIIDNQSDEDGGRKYNTGYIFYNGDVLYAPTQPNCHDQDGYWCCDDIEDVLTTRDGQTVTREEFKRQPCFYSLGPCTLALLDCAEVPQLKIFDPYSRSKDISGWIMIWYFIIGFIVPISLGIALTVCVCQSNNQADIPVLELFVVIGFLIAQGIFLHHAPNLLAQVALLLGEVLFLIWACRLDPDRDAKRERAEKLAIDRQSFIDRLGARAENAKDMNLIRWAYEELTPKGRDSVSTMDELDVLIKRARERKRQKKEEKEFDGYVLLS